MSATATSAAGPVLLFSIATNGYEKHFAALLEKQRAFAAAIGAHYWVAQGRPPWGISAHDSAWMKIPLIVQALRRGYAWVLYLDADCEVLDCPSPVATFAGGRESIFVCRDFSGRINSAVIFVRNTPEAQRVFRRLWRSSFRPAGALPPEDRNLYENGHVIHYLKHEPAVLQMLYDFGYLAFIGSLGCFCAMWMAFGLAILLDENHILPKWLGYYTVWQFVTELVAAPVWIDKSPLFGWLKPILPPSPFDGDD